MVTTRRSSMMRKDSQSSTADRNGGGSEVGNRENESRQRNIKAVDAVVKETKNERRVSRGKRKKSTQNDTSKGSTHTTAVEQQIDDNDYNAGSYKNKKCKGDSDQAEHEEQQQQAEVVKQVVPIPPADFLVYADVDENIIDLISKIYYSNKYYCGEEEFRHVIMPKELYEIIPDEYRDRLLADDEWYRLGIRMSPGWHHYELHEPEPHIFLFRRQRTG
ncbi:hypothetical protein MP228_007570 [Amoeboaphelidium protococcarum]|nr:hypothetical protein MP228_007570 [Amoeboaphelidium protococcarum]